MKRSKQNKAGFSLIEILMAALILSIVIISSAALMIQTGATIQNHQLKREAVVLANTITERFGGANYATLEALDGTTRLLTIDVSGITLTADATFTLDSDVDGTDFIEIEAVIARTDFLESVSVIMRRYEFGLSQAAVE